MRELKHSRLISIVGYFQLQLHDRDDDCDHAIAERDQPVLFHCASPYRRLGRRIAGSLALIVGLTASLTPRKCLGFTRQIAFAAAATATLSPQILRSAPGPVTIWS